MLKEYGMEFLLTRLGSDMRQTLHHIMGLMELTAEEPLSRTQLQNLSKCRASADQLLRTADDASELASADPLQPSPGPFYLAAAISEVIGVMRVLAERKGLELAWSLESNVPVNVVADRDMIQDMLRRVLDHGIRFGEGGAITLSVKAGGVDTDSPVLIFEVTDAGPGVPADFASDPNVSMDAPFSTGLSLSLLRKRLAQAGGRFTIIESTCLGTTVHISIPVSSASAAEPTRDAMPGDAGSPSEVYSQLRLLVVEDSDDSFSLFEAYVKGQGHQISRAVNGEVGVAMAKSGSFDMIVMDVNMPVMNGYTATRKIREWETESGRRRLPILLLSAEHASRQLRLGASVGCSGYLTKPARKGELLKALNYFGNPRL